MGYKGEPPGGLRWFVPNRRRDPWRGAGQASYRFSSYEGPFGFGRRLRPFDIFERRMAAACGDKFWDARWRNGKGVSRFSRGYFRSRMVADKR